MQKYLIGLGGISLFLLLTGAGCDTSQQNSVDTSVSSPSSGSSGVIIENPTTTGSQSDIDSTTDLVVEVKAMNYSFSQKEIRVKKGQKVTINFVNEDGFHDWVVDEFNARTQQISGPASDSISFVADKAGEFEYYCSVGQHRQMGMVGKLIVEDSATTLR